ncbi:hypothetical protein OG331_31450 [Streptomyces sp. NBC_01017]|uniref:hypothetical protein n=1 Tax=Streptomyces sp. NBC_01017 TaxID=2903721 RepID=UPI00386BDCDC|nr:hypothetical protein OG331_31450 [Streptomyces sp. NBC_01017]
MSGSYAEEFGAGGPSDDGDGVAVWLAFQRCAVVEEVGRDARDRQPGGLLTALLEPVKASVGRWGGESPEGA